MSVTVAAVETCLRRMAPLELAERWDNVGLLLGDPDAGVRRLLTCLTITPPVVAEAVARGVNLIVTHHPIFFKPVQRLTTCNAEGRMILDLVRAGVAVFSLHTAYDNCPGGINDQLAQALGLQAIRPLQPLDVAGLCKIVVFTPENDLEPVCAAAFAAGAGIIGNYEQCSFRAPGTGTFLGTEAANPTVGQIGRREEVREQRLEMVCPERLVAAVVAAIRQAHSYEEPALDVYPLRPTPGRYGAGRLGRLPAPLSVAELARRLALALKLPRVGCTGAAERPDLQTVAIACGAGGSLLPAAIQAGADAFLTGELRFHDELSAQSAGITALVIGHYASERPGMEWLANFLGQEFPGIEAFASAAEQDPARWPAAVASD